MQNTDERIKEMGHLDIIQYYSAIKKDQIMTFPATGRKVEEIIVSEEGEKDSCGVTSRWNPKNGD